MIVADIVARGIPVIDHWWQTESGWPIGVADQLKGQLPLGLLVLKAGAAREAGCPV